MPEGDPRELLDYDPATGLFHWKEARGKSPAGAIAGQIALNGYRDIRTKAGRFYGGRLAWFFTYGKWPERFIDHINGVRSDDRIANLREANDSQNQCNRKPTSKSGFKGVYKHSQIDKWVAEIKLDGKKYALGCYDTVEEAAKVRAEAAIKMHGSYAYEARA